MGTPSTGPRGRPPLASASRAEWFLLGGLAAWTVAPLVLLFVGLPGLEAASSGRGTFTGSAGLVINDHAQYISWIREAGDHLLFSNRFDVLPDPNLFLHPMWALSGLLWKLGASLQLAFALWKPVGLVILFAGFAAYVRRTVEPGSWARPAALAMALFFVTPSMWLTGWTGLGDADLEFGSLVMGLELFPAGFVWDIVPTAIAVGLMPLFLLGVERMLVAERRTRGRTMRWYAAWTAAAGAAASWLHPWQGLTLLAILAGLAAWGRLDRRYLTLATPAAATVLPLLYYQVLTRTDSAWNTVSAPNGMPHFGAWLFVGLAPLVLLALPGLRSGPGGDVQERMLRLWPLAALAVYFALDASYFYHALAGMTLPLAVLAARGWHTMRIPSIAAAATVALLTLPGMAYQLDYFHREAPGHFLSEGESAAMTYIEQSPRPGAVLATPDLGVFVPALSGRNTWFGHATWTPSNEERKARSAALFGGELSPQQAQAMVRETTATFLLQGCGEGRADLRDALGPMVAAVRTFGCARVYEVLAPGKSA